jgi:hypothetical protein
MAREDYESVGRCDMTSAEIPERLEWRCMLPVDVLRVSPRYEIECILQYNGAGLEVRKQIRPCGVKCQAFESPIEKWLASTEDHHVELLGRFHGRGNFYGYDRKTKEIRSLWHDMRELGYTVEDDE